MPDIVTITTTNDVVAGSTTTDVVSVGYSLPASAVPALTESATVYVTTDGSDSNDGLSWKTAFATVQHAINSLPTVNGMQTGIVEVGAGTFTSSSTITVAENQAPRIRGRGAGQTYDNHSNVSSPVHTTELHYTGASDAVQVNGPVSFGGGGSSTVPYQVIISDLAITGTASARYGVSVTNTERLQMHNVAIDQFGTFGFQITNTYWFELDWVTITRCGTAGATSQTGGAYFNGGGGNDPVNLGIIKNCIFNENTGYGVWAYGVALNFQTTDFSYTVVNAQSGSGSGIFCQNFSGGYNFDGCWFEGNANYGCDGDGGNAVVAVFENCQFGGASLSTYGINVFGQTLVTGCQFGGHTSGWSIRNDNGFNVNWVSNVSSDSTAFIRGFTNSGAGYPAGDIGTGKASVFGAWGGGMVRGYGARSSQSGSISITTTHGDTINLFLTGNVTASAFDGNTMGQVITVVWVQDSSGSRSYVWPANCKFAGGAAPAASTTANFRDAVTFYCDGANWYEISRSAGIH